MTINHRLRIMLLVMMLFASSHVLAQTPLCKDTAEHNRLQQAMWDCCAQDSPDVLYQACVAFQNHARADRDMFSAYTAWVCGVMYNLGRMNIQDAYHITQVMKEDIKAYDENSEESYFVPNMMGHVYNTCGNIPGALEEFQKSVEMIKGTKYEKDGLAFIYLALAHVQLNNDLQETLHWVDVVMHTLVESIVAVQLELRNRLDGIGIGHSPVIVPGIMVLLQHLHHHVNPVERLLKIII